MLQILLICENLHITLIQHAFNVILQNQVVNNTCPHSINHQQCQWSNKQTLVNNSQVYIYNNFNSLQQPLLSTIIKLAQLVYSSLFPQIPTDQELEILQVVPPQLRSNIIPILLGVVILTYQILELFTVMLQSEDQPMNAPVLLLVADTFELITVVFQIQSQLYKVPMRPPTQHFAQILLFLTVHF
ncbi:Hypothetical_protein [Hexamita inflata]|uniref:Hypothetical_protein n=1 Tax=Hexamita inflata TaxID=28002 RepID=A0AA86P6Z0_9EUKA|nr:Hypothetical protein HINF_LOCUS20952 [Hexamita inflata]